MPTLNLRKISKNKLFCKKIKIPPYIESIRRFFMYYVPQLNSSDCGFACLKMLLASLNHDRRYLTLPCDENHGFYSFKELSEVASKNGVYLTGFKVIDKNEILRHDSFPVIARLNLGNEKYHAVIVKRINKRYAHIVDPHIGKYKMPYQEFKELWDGTGLFVHSYEKKKSQNEIIEPISKKEKWLTVLLQFLSGISIIVGIYFINPEGNFWIPLVCLFLGITFEVLLRYYLYKLMYKLDTYFEDRINEISPKYYFSYYERCQQFKSNYLTNNLNVIYSILVSMFVIFISIFNNVLNFPLVIASIGVSVLEVILFKNKEKEELVRLSDEEEMLKDEKDKESVLKKVKLLQTKAYKFSQQKLLKKYLGTILFLLVAIFVQIINKSFTLLNVIFALCIEIFLYQNLLPIFEYENKQIEMITNRAKLSNVFFGQVHHKDENK